MLAQQFDLLGDFQSPAVSSEKTPATSLKPLKKLVINRRALFSSTSCLPGVTEADDDEEVADVTTTSDTYSDNSTMERLENALGMAPILKDGKWATDSLGFKYRLKGQPFKGVRTMGAPGSLVRDCNQMLILQSARSCVEALFVDPCSWLCLHSVSLLAVRLRMMSKDEDPFACFEAFKQVMEQQDFIDNSRKGETIRNLAKRDRMRGIRAKERLAKERQRSSDNGDSAGDQEM